jgi:anthraniloyl-CoA monooxygenase
VKIDVLGAGPAGLYFAILMKRTDPRHGVTVYERNQPDATFGWGVVFSETSLDALEYADYQSFVAIDEACSRWDPIDVRYHGTVTRVRGNGFSGIGRRRLLNLLQGRAREVGVDLVFGHEVERLDDHLAADLVVGADGANSLLRRQLADAFRPSVTEASSKYAWYGAEMAFPVFTYIFKETEWGLFQAHCYPYDESRSTMVLLLSEETWRRAGLDELDEKGSLELCQQVFADDLQGREMLSNRSLWINFPWIRCQSWHAGNVVLLGDAAHTAHWSIGSGTKLALEDSIALARSLVRYGALAPAFAEYELDRQPAVERFQEASRVSCQYFESVSRYLGFEPPQFAYQLMTRTPRVTHLNLAGRDPEFVRSVESHFHQRASGRSAFAAPPPTFAPLRLRSLELDNRIVYWQRPGEPVPEDGAGLVLTELHAVSEAARISPETPVELPPPPAGGSPVCLRLGHAGPRGACRSPRWGLDSPLGQGGWPLVAASAVPYSAWQQTPGELTAREIEQVRSDFEAAARRAAAIGYRMLLLDFSRGGLLASFISPLTNRRRDEFGGGLEGRLRFPLEALGAVRAAWPAALPLAVAYSAADHLPGGLDAEDSVEVARRLAHAGADLLLVLSGQTLAGSWPPYGRSYGAALSDGVRNGSGALTCAFGQITTVDEVNTILAAGRADLCVLDRISRSSPP